MGSELVRERGVGADGDFGLWGERGMDWSEGRRGDVVMGEMGGERGVEWESGESVRLLRRGWVGTETS